MDEAPELRIALAMRGGVSLAVWMGGACSEIDALRRAVPASLAGAGPIPRGDAVLPTAEVYARLLAACGYSGVAVDVVAGASAGGLNGALMGCGVVHGMPLGREIRDLWLVLGDIGALVRGRALQAAPSVLDGDGRFYAPLFERMSALTSGAGEPPLGSVRFDLTLTGTLFHPRPSTRYQDLGDVIVEPRHRARFRFRHLPGPDGSLLCDFGRETGTQDAALQRLAYAARTTSSFPGAFEPALIGCTEVPAAGSQQGSGPAPPPASLYGVYSESRQPGNGDVTRDLVIDGGVLDNIPVAWAVRSIAAAPAQTSVHRWLVYLQPVPFKELEKLGASDERRPDLRGTVKHARKLRSGTETLSEDIDELERLRRSALSREGFRMVVEYALGEKRGAYTRDDGSPVAAETDAEFLRGLFGRALAATGAYRQRLGVVEASRLRQLLADPQPVLGADPLGYAQFRWISRPGGVGAELLERLPAGASLSDAVLSADEVTAAEEAAEGTLAEQTAALVRIGRAVRTPQALARTVAALLDSARDLGADGQALKRQLYDERTRIELLIAWHDRHLAAEPFKPGLAGAEPVEVARRALRRLAQPQPYELGDEAPVAGGWPAAPFAARWDELVASAGALAAGAQEPQRAVLSCLMSAASGEVDRAARLEAVLVATELLTGPSRPDPLAETTHIRFHMLSARNVSSLVEGLRREVEQPLTVDERRPLTVDEKLAGNQLANFGAFLRARWRQNDWIWGRLDAARSLVDIVTAPDPEASSVVGTGGDAAGRVDWTSLAELAGVRSDAAREEVTDALVALLHERILREELPLLRDLGGGPPSQEQLSRNDFLTGEVDEEAVRPLLRTGQETVASALVKDPLRLGIALRLLDLGALGWTSGSARTAASSTVAAANRGRDGLTDRIRRASTTLRGALRR